LGLTETILQFTFYEYFKRLETERMSNINNNTITPLTSFCISSAAKLLASMMTYPHEVIRTRLREQKIDNKYKGAFHGLFVVAREEGLRGLYGGLGPHLLRVVPNAGLLFMTYELTLSYFARNFPLNKV